MKVVFSLALFTLMCAGAHADILKLRDGRTISGQFLGATRTEIWFQRDLPGEVIGTMAYPIAHIESLTFGDMRQSGKSNDAGYQSQPWCAGSKDLFRNAAWPSSPCTRPRGLRRAATLQP